MPTSPAAAAPRAFLLEHADADADLRIWGLRPVERLERALANAGCTRVERLRPSSLPADDPDGPALLLRSDLVYDARLIDGLAATAGVVLCTRLDPDGPEAPVAAHGRLAELSTVLPALRDGTAAAATPDSLRRVGPDELAPPYIPALRKYQPAYVLAPRPETRAAIEARLFGAAYKTVTDLVTRWLWPRPAAALTRVLAERRVHPNVITIASWALAILAALLFAAGSFGWGLVCAWAMTFLDTVDGKLARVTLTSSRIGHVLDHGLDLTHPPFWYWAWGVGASGGVDWATAVVIAGYFAGRGLEGIFLLAFGMETHCWRRVDNLFRTITARRNPNLILLTVAAIAGAPATGMEMVAVWTLASLGFHSVRLVQALLARRRGEPIRAWDEAPVPPARPSPA